MVKEERKVAVMMIMYVYPGRYLEKKNWPSLAFFNNRAVEKVSRDLIRFFYSPFLLLLTPSLQVPRRPTVRTFGKLLFLLRLHL